MRKKKAVIYEISGLILFFSFISIFYITLAILQFAIWNDYVIWNMQNITETLESQGVLNNGTSLKTQVYADSYRNFNMHYDDIWFLVYALFIASSFVIAYRAKPQNYFGFLSVLFYGIMFLLFLLTIFVTLTNWWKDNILTRLLPEAIIHLPKFYYYLDHVGIFTAVQLVICLVINLVDFDFTKINQRKEQEKQSAEGEEVL